MHRVLAQHHRRGIKVEHDGGVTIGDDVTVRRDSINHEIARLDSGRVNRIAEFDNEIGRRSPGNHTATG